MSNSTHPIICAISLVTLAGMLGGCPVVEPVIPEPESPTPVSGVWGLQIADVSADGFCGHIGAAAIGRVIRMDVVADRDGELALSFFGFDVYGGHADGQAWANAELSGYWGGAYDTPVVVYEGEEDGDLMEEEAHSEGSEGSGHSEGSEGSGHSEGSGSTGDPEEGESPTVSCVSEESDPEEGREPHCDTPDPYMEPGLFLAFDAEIIDARTMDGFIELTVSDGYDACTFDAEVNAAYLSEDADFDLIGHPEDIAVRGPDTEAPVAEGPEPAE